jgi:hypothetical protein
VSRPAEEPGREASYYSGARPTTYVDLLAGRYIKRFTRRIPAGKTNELACAVHVRTLVLPPMTLVVLYVHPKTPDN